MSEHDRLRGAGEYAHWQIDNFLTPATWLDVGASGAPAFVNSWVNYGSPFAVAAFCKDTQGFVHLRGTIKSGTVGADAFVLPAGYRPSAIRLFPVVSNVAFGAVQVEPDGSVVISGICSNVYVALDGITFLAA